MTGASRRPGTGSATKQSSPHFAAKIQSSFAARLALDCFASLAMTGSVVYYPVIPGRRASGDPGIFFSSARFRIGAARRPE